MKTFENITELRGFLKKFHKEDKTIGLVPTMGYLHEGHMSLVKTARKECDIIVASIFVNPAQFAPNEDLESYPRDLKKDLHLLEKEGCDIVFLPENNEIYNNDFETYINLEKLPKHLCGLSRPTHFRGVATVVTKLFNIIQPGKAYFGQKDYQQILVIKKLIRDLNVPVKIIMCPIVRNDDGLALSSRNMYLTKDERKDAVLLHQSLLKGVERIKAGNKEINEIIVDIKAIISQSQHAKVDYISISNGETLKEIGSIKGYKGLVLLAGAVRFGKSRLIDNELVEL
ncbi:pantoate--beta-alanine ligase [Candidatus Dependentiae bacterium]|nr:pantoate--beta-alanine ligase [Candidatus Dependentiae bacterium]